MIEIRTAGVTGVNPFVPVLFRPRSGSGIKLIPTARYLEHAPKLLVFSVLALTASVVALLDKPALLWPLVPAFMVLIVYRMTCLRTVDVRADGDHHESIAPVLVLVEHVVHNCALTSLALLVGKASTGLGVEFVGVLVVVTLAMALLPIASLALHGLLMSR